MSVRKTELNRKWKRKEDRIKADKKLAMSGVKPVRVKPAKKVAAVKAAPAPKAAKKPADETAEKPKKAPKKKTEAAPEVAEVEVAVAE